MLSLLHTLLPNSSTIIRQPLPKSLKGVKILITGATNGLGLAVAEKFAQMGAHLIIAGRDEEKCVRIVEYLTSRKHKDSILERYPLDLASFQSIRNFVQLYAQQHSDLHILVCNAGILSADRRVSLDGHELTLATNHLGHFLLTNLLLPFMREAHANMPEMSDFAGPARILIISSVMHTMGSLSNLLDDPNVQQRPYSQMGWSEYSDSKLANLLFAYELDRRLRESNTHINVYAIHPGTMASGLFNDMSSGSFGYVMNPIKSIFFTDPNTCANSIVHVATSTQKGDESGKYYSGVNMISSSDASYNLEAQTKLWLYSEKVCNL